MAPRPLHELVEAGWAKALEPAAERIAAMGDFLRAEIAAGRTYLPAGANVLRAFQQPFDDVRVLIVGQDPYPTPGMAIGLSFAVSPEVRSLPGSLENIFREMHSDLGLPRPSNGDLTPWAEQGVLLLNRALTTAPRKPGAHRGQGWEEVTEQAIRALAARGSRWCRSCGGVTREICGRCWGIFRPLSPLIPRPCRPTADSSARDRSAAPTTCCFARVPSRWTGDCRRTLHRAVEGAGRRLVTAYARECRPRASRSPRSGHRESVERGDAPSVGPAVGRGHEDPDVLCGGRA